MEKEQFLSLIEKFLNNKATDDEKNLVEAYYHKMQKNRFKLLNPEQEEILKNRLMRKIEAELWPDQILEPYKQTRGHSVFWLRLTAAAAVLIVIVSVLFFFRSSKTNKVAQIDYAVRILPGGNKAVLILGDGAKIDLASADQGRIAEQTGQEIKKTAEGNLVYNQLKNKKPYENLESSFNTIITPNGGKFVVVLSDGTRVWLNAATSIRYPSTFSPHNRIVELNGEAYFEVAHDTTRPFIVKTEKQNVEVLGTHFNISAYNDDETTKTTLLEGSVTVNSLSGNTSHKNVHLFPGQQSQLTKTKLVVDEVDADAAIDWKNGKFIFRNEDIRSIMKKISRWYDIEVDYEGNVENLRFGGKVSRSKNLKEALRVLTLTGDVNIKVVGRRVTIMP